MAVPVNPKIYHIVHVDKLTSIATDGFLFSDAELAQRPANGTVIGMNNIKARRMHELTLASRPGLYVGQCVPFYFCPRSVMLYLIHRRNSELAYKGGQGPIVHLVADLQAAVAWADANARRWAFTLSNAGSFYFVPISESCTRSTGTQFVPPNGVGAQPRSKSRLSFSPSIASLGIWSRRLRYTTTQPDMLRHWPYRVQLTGHLSKSGQHGIIEKGPWRQSN